MWIWAGAIPAPLEVAGAFSWLFFSFFLLLAAPGHHVLQDSAVGTGMECAEDPTVFWEAAAVGALLGMLQAVLRAGGKQLCIPGLHEGKVTGSFDLD